MKAKTQPFLILYTNSHGYTREHREGLEAKTSCDNDPQGVGRAWRTTSPTSEHKTTPKQISTLFNSIIQNVQKTSNHLFNIIVHVLTKYLLLIVETPYIHIQGSPLLLLTLNTLLIIYSTLTKYILQLVETRPPS